MYIPQKPLLVLTSAVVVSSVRSHNVAHVSKSHESFGDRFSTVTIDDLVTSDLQAAVKGTRCASPASSSMSLKHVLGVDAIIHIASPLPNNGTPEVILDVRSNKISFPASWLIKYIFLDRRYRNHAHSRRCCRRWRQETCHYAERSITHRTGGFRERHNNHRK